MELSFNLLNLTNFLLTPILANSGRYNFPQAVFFSLSLPKKERYLIILRIESTILLPPKKQQNPANEIEVTIPPMLKTGLRVAPMPGTHSYIISSKPSFNNYLLKA